MVHLQGEWGSGKSSFLNFIEKNLNSDGDKWVVVKYNAWKNQHISPPWWTLIDQIYKQSKESLTNCSWFGLCLREKWRRIIWYSGWEKIVSLVFTIVFCVVLYKYGSSLLGFLVDTPLQGSETESTMAEGAKETTKLAMEFDKDPMILLIKLIVTFGSLFGVLYSLSKFIATPFFINTSGEAASFISRAQDPMNRIKKHFGKLVNDISSKKENRELAVFIDDIDRCNEGFIVEFLEGIQTLFKDERVLYIIAGDKKWISTSFNNVYKSFGAVSSNENKLGELFLEKAFQLSFRMPNVSDRAKEDFWKHLLGDTEDTGQERIDSNTELQEEVKDKIKSEINNNRGKLTDPVFMKELENQFNMTPDYVTDILIKAKNENSQEIKHLLQEYHSVIKTNPRSIIRLANNYTMVRSTLMAERITFSEDKLFRWLVIEDLFPEINEKLNTMTAISDIENVIEDMKDNSLRARCLELLNEKPGGQFSIEDISHIKGL